MSGIVLLQKRAFGEFPGPHFQLYFVFVISAKNTNCVNFKFHLRGQKVTKIAQIHTFEKEDWVFDTGPGFVAGFMIQTPLCPVLSSATLPNLCNAMTQHEGLQIHTGEEELHIEFSCM